MSSITKIEAKKPLVKERKRVAAYARVSMESDRLEHSLSAQISYYSSLIQKNPEWIYAGVYSDNGISGTQTANRHGFQEMIADAEAGKIDIILTKSISRFARNTVDLLETVRHLKDIGVEVRFERENIRSLSSDGELMLSILASFAQEESRSLSKNIKWGVRKRYEKGHPHVCQRALGYRWNGEQYEIVPEEAKTVRYLFDHVIRGETVAQIVKDLNAAGNPGIDGRKLQRDSTRQTLKNQIYIGRLILQKTFIPDGAKRKVVKNTGELPMYVIDDAHEAIIDEETFWAVQKELDRRGKGANNQFMNPSPFSGMIECGYCGKHFGRVSQGGHHVRYKVWKCRTRKLHGIDACRAVNIREYTLEDMAAEALELEKFDEAAFKRIVRKIVLYDDYGDFFLNDGKRSRISRPAETCLRSKKNREAFLNGRNHNKDTGK